MTYEVMSYELLFKRQEVHQVQFVFSQNILARIPGISVPTGGDENPYMEGQKLPVAAKKGMF